MFVIKRINGRRGYVARPGSPGSYTPHLERARTFQTEEEAKGESCPENEIVLRISKIFR